MMMIPVALASIFSKRIATRVISRSGYRNFLVGNTVCVGAMIASFAFISAAQPLFVRIVQLAIFGTVNSLQFTAMNSLTLKDLDPRGASSGNSLFSMVQMLALSFGVATAGAVLSTFTDAQATTDSIANRLHAFHATFVCMGLITCTSAWIFWRLSPDVVPKNGKPQLDAGC
jgi:MFS family permease